MDDDLRTLVNYVVMPLFAFANASISFEGFTLASLEGVSVTIFVSLVLGKLIGIFSFTYVFIKCGWLTMPDKMDMHSLFGVSLLGGIGFTVSLFIATLSYTGMGAEGAILLNQAKIGIIGGSLFAGVCGYFYLKYALNKKTQKSL